jgi:hypothetical protein
MGSQPKTIVGNGIFIYILVRIFHYWLAISFPRWFIGQLELTISLEKASPILRGGSEVRDQSELEEDLTNFFETPSKTGDKRGLRAAPPKKYAVDGDEELGGTGSDDSDFDPNAEREKEQKARQRRGIAGGSSDEYHQ